MAALRPGSATESVALTFAALALAACTADAPSTGGSSSGRPPSEARRIPAQRPTPEIVINQASSSCPATPLEMRTGPQGPYYERDGWTVRLREPSGPWRAGQPRLVVWLPAIYYTDPTFEVLAEPVDAEGSIQLFVASLEGAGYSLDLSLPRAGCWRLTARLAEDRGSVVVPVEP
jgi:hypothetical protein